MFFCSPNACGITARIGEAFAQGLQTCGHELRFIKLYNYKITPCMGCDPCRAPDPCIFANDDAANLFAILNGSDAAVFLSPVYFYAMPAHFKAFMDRGQWYWSLNKLTRGEKPAICLQAAGRAKGNLLFSATLRSLSWFLKTVNFRIVFHHGWRDLDNIAKWNKALEKNVIKLGEEWGSRFNLNF